MSRGPAIAAAFGEHAFRAGRAAWLLTDAAGRLIEKGGEEAWLGLPPLAPGDDVRVASDFLAALLDPQVEYDVVPRVELRAGLAADVHRGALADGSCFLLFLDVSADASSETLLRQRGLDLGRLLRGLGSEALERGRLGEGWLQAMEQVQRDRTLVRERVSSLRVRLVEIADTLAPDVLLARRESLLREVLEVLLERTGMAELDGTWAVQTWCGLVLASRDPGARALEVAAALRARVATEPGAAGRVAIGVASGSAVVGRLSLPGGDRLAVLGPLARRATELAEQAAPGEILCDASTTPSAAAAQVRLVRVEGAEVAGEGVLRVS